MNLDRDFNKNTIRFDIRNEYNQMFTSSIDGIFNMLIEILHDLISLSHDNQTIVINNILNIIESHFVKRNILYLLKNMEIYRGDVILEKKIKSLLNSLSKRMDDLLKNITGYLDKKINFYEVENDLEKIIYIDGQKITDLYLFGLLLKNTNKLNLIYSGMAHFKNIAKFLHSIGYKRKIFEIYKK